MGNTNPLNVINCVNIFIKCEECIFSKSSLYVYVTENFLWITNLQFCFLCMIYFNKIFSYQNLNTCVIWSGECNCYLKVCESSIYVYGFLFKTHTQDYEYLLSQIYKWKLNIQTTIILISLKSMLDCSCRDWRQVIMIYHQEMVTLV